MIIAIVLLGALVYVLAKSAPSDPNADKATSLAPSNNIAATGTTGIPSPAAAGGYGNEAMISQSNQLRTSMTYQNVTRSQKHLPGMAPSQQWRTAQRASSDEPNYLTDAQSSLMTQDVPATTTTVYDQGIEGTKV